VQSDQNSVVRDPFSRTKGSVFRSINHIMAMRVFVRLCIVVLTMAWSAMTVFLTSLVPYAIGGQVREILLAFVHHFGPARYALVGLVLMYQSFDVQVWKSKFGRFIRLLSQQLILLASIATALTMTPENAAIPLLLLVVIQSFVVFFVKSNFFHNLESIGFARCAAKMYMLAGIVCGVCFCIWIATEGSSGETCNESRMWNIFMRETAFKRANCPFQLDFVNGNGTIQSIECTFEGGCHNLTDPVWQENLSKAETGACKLRSSEILKSVASLVFSSSSNLTWVAAGVLQNEEGEVVRVQYVGCLAALILWMSPFIVAVSNIVIGGGLLFVASIDSTSKSLKKVFVRILAIFVLSLWTAASIAGADLALSNTVATFSLFGILVMSMFFVLVRGWSGVTELISSNSAMKKIVETSTENDWGRALVLLCFAPALMFSILMSAWTQLMRRLNPCCVNKHLSEDDRKHWVTIGVSKRLKVIGTWPWTSILKKTIILGLLFNSIQVVIAKFTSVLLSYVNEWIKSQNFSMVEVTGLFFAFGILTFLNPLVPGVPVYISGGILLVEATQPFFSDNQEIAFWLAVSYAVLISLLLKLCAVAVQQKVFGEMFGRSIKIRSFINVNSSGIKAIKLILSDRGLSFRKCAILVGGPDWPTSVTTGILRLPLLSMLIGTLPIVILIVPCVLSGALLLRVDEGSIWSSLSVLSIGLAFVMQTGAMLMAGHVIAQVASERQTEIDAIANDEEVESLAKRTLKKREISVRKRDWHRNKFPFLAKFFLISGTIAMIAAFDLVVAFGSSCFKPFQVSDSIQEKLDGNPLNLILFPFGWICLGLIAVAMLFLTMADMVLSCADSKTDKIYPMEGGKTAEESLEQSVLK